jgi:hypothetical protein
MYKTLYKRDNEILKKKYITRNKFLDNILEEEKVKSFQDEK